MSDSQTPIEGWCIIDLFGHQQIAGYVTTVVIGTSAMLRVEIPEIDTDPGYTRFYGLGAIYSLTLVTEALARAALRSLRPEAVTVYIPRQLPPARDENLDQYRQFRPDEDKERARGCADDAIPF
jgi:hypothetical protein